MNLYIWNDPYKVSWGGSMLYAVAETEDEARNIAKTALISHFGSNPDPEDQHNLGEIESVADINLGSPTRVMPVPCAEFYEWCE